MILFSIFFYSAMWFGRHSGSTTCKYMKSKVRCQVHFAFISLYVRIFFANPCRVTVPQKYTHTLLYGQPCVWKWASRRYIP